MNTQNIRRMTVAGQFYESNPTILKKQFEKFNSSAKKILSTESMVRSIIVPHAGFIYSGKTAFDAFYQTKDCQYDRVVLLTPSHYVGFSGVSLPYYDLCETPFGNIKVDLASVKLLDSEYFIQNSHSHLKEHSLEVQLPLIKYFFPDIKLIPLVCGQLDQSMLKPLSESLSKLWDDNTLWVVSSDFTHYGRSFGYMPFTSNVKDNLKQLDGSAIEKILAFDEKGFTSYLEKTGATICGANPIRLMLTVLNNPKTQLQSRLISYTTSGDLTGDYSHCVSYASIAFYN